MFHHGDHGDEEASASAFVHTEFKAEVVALVRQPGNTACGVARELKGDPVSRYRFVEAEKVKGANVAKACELLEVSRSAFYDWHQHRPSTRELADEQLAERIQVIFDDSGGTYGWPRVHWALRRQGVHVGRARVARIMRQNGLIGQCRHPKTRTTISDPEAKAADLIKRRFGPGTVELDRVYVGDITYIHTWQGWLYLATVIDLASSRAMLARSLAA